VEGHWECDGIGEIRGLRGFVLWVTMILLEKYADQWIFRW
jgi:hypothetical protein